MTNKKLWLSLLAVVLIVCMLSVGLMSCKKKTEEEEPEPEEEVTLEEQAAEAIIEGIQKSLAAADMTDLRLDGEIELTVGEKVYTVALALDLDLRQFNGYEYTQCTKNSTFNASEQYFKVKEDDEEEYEEAKGLTEEEFNKSKTTYYTRHKKDLENDNFSNTALTAEIREGSKVLLGVYYSDSQADIEDKDPFTGDMLYVQYLPEGATKTTKMKFNAPYVAATMLALGGSVDFHGIDLAELDIWDTLGGVLPIIGSLADKTQTEFVANQKASLTINLGAVLNQFSDVLSSASGYVDPLGLELNLSDLGTILPAISIKLAADLDSTGMATNVGLSLTIPEKDVEIKNKDTKKTFLNINMTKDVEIGLGLRYTLYDTEENPNYFFPSDEELEEYKKFDNIIDVDLSIDLSLKEALSYSIKLNGQNMTLAVNPGDYTLSLDAALKPFELLKYIKGVEKDGVTKKIDFSSTPKIIDSIDLILEAISGLDIKLVKYTDETRTTPAAKDGEKTLTDGKVLQVVVADDYSDLGNGTYQNTGKKKVTVNAAIISGDTSITLNGAEISSAITLVKGFIEKSGEAPEGTNMTASTEEEKQDTITPILTEVGKYLAGAVIRINNGGEYGKVYAHFDSKDTVYGVIPFGGYTKWTGDYNSKWTYYTQKTAGEYVKNEAAFDASKKYYTHKAATFTKLTAEDKAKGFDDMRCYYEIVADKYKLSEDTSFVANKDYYIYEGEKWEEANITAFETGVDYYTYKEATYEKADITEFAANTDYYVKGLSDKGDFGLGLAATLKIDENIEIEATITNLDIFGFPASITAKISNLDVNLWDNDFTIFIGGVLNRYSTVYGHISKAA